MKKLALALFGVLCFSASVPAPAYALGPSNYPGCQYLATPPSLSDKQTVVAQCDNTGALIVSGTFSASFTGFTPTGAASLAVTNATGRVALANTDGTVILQNSGTGNLFFKLGSVAVTAATTDYSLPAGYSIAVKITSETHVAAITAGSDTTTLKIIQGTGIPQFAGGGGSGSGGGGAVTVADGADVTQGAKADAKSTATDTTPVTQMQVLKEISAMEQAPASRAVTNGGTFAVQAAQSGTWNVGALTSITNALPSGTNVIGGVRIDQSTPGTTNGVQLPASQVVTVGTAGSSSADVLSVQGIASGTPLGVAIPSGGVASGAIASGAFASGAVASGAIASGAVASGAFASGSIAAGAVAAGATSFVKLEDVAAVSADAGVPAMAIQKAAPADTAADGDYSMIQMADGAVWVHMIPSTAGGLTNYFVQPTASDNHVVIKAGAGQVYKIMVTNNSATVNYLRLYNATTGFNGCNASTNIVYQVAIPASTTVGGISDSWPQGMAFSTGISICVTSGYATNDTTNATATAMSVNIGYR